MEKVDPVAWQLESPVTFLCTPFPLFPRVDSFKLSRTYVSHTTSSVCVLIEGAVAGSG